jgi:hypothetical protein
MARSCLRVSDVVGLERRREACWKKEERVRAGETGHHVRYVLHISLALVIVLFVLIAVFIR